jgi:hypothetical protein
MGIASLRGATSCLFAGLSVLGVLAAEKARRTLRLRLSLSKSGGAYAHG